MKITVADKFGSNSKTYVIDSSFEPEARNMARDKAMQDGIEDRWDCVQIMAVEP